MKNKIVLFVVITTFFLSAVSITQAKTLNQQSLLLTSVSQMADSFSELLASVVNILAKQSKNDAEQATTSEKAKEIVETIKAQTEALKAIVDENKGIGAQNTISETVQEIGVAVQQITQTLKPGTTGKEVKILQKHLSSQLDIYPQGLVTGYYGPLTEQAVKNFQEKAGFEPVGIVGPKTREAINQELAVASAAASAYDVSIIPFKSSSKDFAPGEILFKFKDNLSEAEQASFLQNWGFIVKDEIKQIKVKILKVPDGTEEELAQSLSHNPKIEFAEVNRIVSPTFIPNDPQYPSEWHHPKINSPSAWDVVNGSNIIIAILDTGVDCTHPDLITNCVSGWNVVSNNSDTTDIYGHGTMVAGTAAAIGNNNNQVVGEAYAAKIMPVRITNDSAAGYAYWSDIANGITYAADHGAKIVNNSYQNVSESSGIRSASQYMKSKGGLVVVAAGNSGALTGVGDVPEMIVVSATGSDDTRTSWSSYGDNVDVAAPGASILTTTAGGGTSAVSGTSFSTPLTAGTLALIWSVNNAFTPDQTQKILFDTVKDIGTAGWDQYYGWGRIDAGAAVTLAKNTQGPTPDTTSPTTSITTPSDGSTVSGLVSVSVSALDNVGVSKVELWKNGTLFATDTSSPYSFLWDTAKDTNGTYSLQSKAYDAAGNVGSSTQTSVNVSNTADTIIPMVNITKPADNSTLPSKGSVSITASASDNVRVAEVDILFDSILKTSCLSATTCSYSLNTRKISSGSHIISAKAYDAAGNVGTSQIIVYKGAATAASLLYNTDSLENVDSIAVSPSLSLPEYTTSLLKIVNELKKASVSEKQAVVVRLTAFAKARKDALLQIIKINPQAVLQNAVSASVRDTLPTDIQPYIESETILEGILEVFHVDGTGSGKPFTDLDSRYFYDLKDANGNKTHIFFVKDAPALITGDKIRVHGIKLDDNFAAAGGTSVTALTTSPTVLTNSFGAKKTLVMLINFPHNTTQPYTVASAQSVMNTTSNFDKENSFTQTWLTGVKDTAQPADVAGWFTISDTNTACDTSTWSSQAKSAAQAAGYDLTQYSRYIVAFPNNSACNWWGWGQIGGTPSTSWINGSFQLGVAAHEMGHNFGLYHSHSLACAAGTCTQSEYGDVYDMMGGSYTNHFNTFQKERLGWLNYNISPPVTAVSTSGAYTISPYETNDASPKALKVLKDASTSTYYYVEYRAGLGFDSGTTAVVLHTAGDTSVNTSNLWDLDQTTSTSDWVLNLGQTYTDPAIGVSFTLVSMDATGAKVQIDFGPIACVRANPAIAISPSSQSGFAGKTLSYNVSVTNNDNAGCTTSIFSIVPTLPAGAWSQTPSSISFSLAPGASLTQAIAITSDPASPAGSFTFTETASSTSVAASVSGIYTVQTPDITPPTVIIISPADGTIVSKKPVKISVSASDASGIAEIDILLDNSLLTSCYGLTFCSVNASTNSLSVGPHSITAKAIDNGGPTANTASTSITIIKK